MRKNLLLLLVLVGCGSSDNKTTDAAVQAVTCTDYCNEIASACTGANAQYGGANAADVTAHCMSTCGAFDPSSNQSGATLGCHAYHATNAMTMDPTVHCPHAGPGGDVIGMAGICGDPCTNFCQIEIAACGTMGAAGNTTGQYASMSDCMTKCAMFSTATPYKVNTTALPSTNPSGDNLACRLYHATNAIISGQAAVHCPHTAGPGVMNGACHN